MAFFAALVSFGNITDYGSNFAFVQHVLRMDTVFPDSAIRYRAMQLPALHHIAYGAIIFLETVIAVLCGVGGVVMLRNLRAPAVRFNRNKHVAMAGLALGFLLWQVGFMSIGGEWFGMWMSSQWNGVGSAFRIFVTFILVMIFVAMPDRDGDG
jgi:predicted small integral membrane protein